MAARGQYLALGFVLTTWTEQIHYIMKKKKMTVAWNFFVLTGEALENYLHCPIMMYSVICAQQTIKYATIGSPEIKNQIFGHQ